MGLLRDLFAHVQLKLRSVDVRHISFTVFRGILALAHLLALAFTPYTALTQTVAGTEAAPQCGGVRMLSTFCVGGDAIPTWMRIAVMIVLLGLVMVGFVPRVMSVVHAWIAVSFSTSISLPDGGDSVASIVAILVIFIAFADNRTWGWSLSRGVPSSAGRGLALAGLYALRIQVALIYLNSAFDKFGVEDWSNGSAEYYIARGYMFGASGIIAVILHWATSIPILLAALTWGVIIMEICIGLLVLTTDLGRRVAFVLAVVLHVGIILTVGLWSFAMIMIATVGIATMLTTSTRLPRDTAKRAADPAVEAATDETALAGASSS
jgi:antimicrobial peptide system SdpB family protein